MTEENTQLQNPSPEEAPEPLVFTDACVAKVKELLAAEEDPNMAAVARASSTVSSLKKRRRKTTKSLSATA